MREIVEHLVTQKQLKSPLLLRFPQLLESQLLKLSTAYEEAAREFKYNGRHFPVFPMKVNPRREVVETFLRDGVKQSIGLEAGSKAELYAALSLEQPPESLLICNGFKDETFIRLALLGVQAGKCVVVVVEKLNELKMIIRLAKETGVTPLIGLRAKLYSRGSGKWAASGGEAAKFGLTASPCTRTRSPMARAICAAELLRKATVRMTEASRSMEASTSRIRCTLEA